MHLFGDATLQDLPDTPRFVLNATNVQSKVLWRFSKPYAWDYRVGKIDHTQISLAVAVSASSAFPPFLSPVILNFKETDFVPDTGLDLQKAPCTTKVFLTDGGVYDNLGLETAWKQFKSILVSDGGGLAPDEPEPAHNWEGMHTGRWKSSTIRCVVSANATSSTRSVLDVVVHIGASEPISRATECRHFRAPCPQQLRWHRSVRDWRRSMMKH